MPLRTDGAEIRRRRELAGMTGVEFAAAIGYTTPWLSNIENGHVNGGPVFQRKAASVLGCDIADITIGSVPHGTVTKASAA